MKKLVVYSAIFGGYDTPLNHFKISDADYVMFSDRQFSSPPWKVRKVPILPKLGPQRTNRFYKLHPHMFFSEYEYSLYIDGNWQLTGDLFKPMKEHMGHSVICCPTNRNYWKKDSYDEGEHCIKLCKAPEKDIKAQLEYYRRAGLPENFGLWGCQFMLRRHNTVDCVQLMYLWWCELKAWTVRDQISFPFVCYIKGLYPTCITGNRLKGLVRKYRHAG